MPDQLNDPTLWLANVFQEGQEMMRPFITGGAAPATSHPGPDRYAQFAAATKDIAEMQQNYLKQMSNLWFDMAGMAGDTIGAADRDKRFAGDAWQNDSRFDLLKRAYLAYSGLLQSSVEWAPVDDKTRRQLRFAVRSSSTR